MKNKLALHHYLATVLGMFAVSSTVASPVLAQVSNFDVLIDGLGGPAGFGELSQGRNDDGSSSELDLPFNVNFFGNEFSTFFVNNNGNITFDSPLSAFTPEEFPLPLILGDEEGSASPIIAPYWADVDTSCEECGEVYVAAPNDETVIATWNEVGYFDSNSTPTNTFQVVLRDRSSDFAPGDFDIEFRYADLNWTTGDASGGSGGLGGTPAQAGFDALDGENFLTLPGSFTEDILNLVDISNVGQPGLFSYSIRNGELPGSSPENPLLPIFVEDGFNFDFNVESPEERIFIDPEVATGYNYFVNSGPNVSSVQVATDAGDGIYDLFLSDGAGGFTDSGTDIATNEIFDFTSLSSSPNGVDSFSIRGIEVDAGLDPNNPLAFTTGLTFVEEGMVNFSQNPIVENTDDPTTTSVPEPASVFNFLALGTFGLGSILLRNQKTRKLQ